MKTLTCLAAAVLVLLIASGRSRDAGPQPPSRQTEQVNIRPLNWAGPFTAPWRRAIELWEAAGRIWQSIVDFIIQIGNAVTMALIPAAPSTMPESDPPSGIRVLTAAGDPVYP